MVGLKKPLSATQVEPVDMVSAYDAARHPAVLAGRQSQDEAMREFLETFDVGGVTDGKVCTRGVDFCRFRSLELRCVS